MPDKIPKLMIEDIIPEYLEGETKKAALEFVAYLRSNKISLRLSTANTDTWKAMYKSKCICTIGFSKNWAWVKNNAKWEVIPHLNHLHEYEKSITDEDREIILYGILYCNGCPPSKGGKRYKDRPCIGGYNRTIFGQEIGGICVNIQLTRAWDPNEATMNSIKRLLELEQKARLEESIVKKQK